MLRIPNLIQWRLRVRNVSCDFNDNIVGDTARSQEVTVSQIPHNLDSEARAELLCYLVASQLTARALTGTWLSAPNVIESLRIWLRANGAATDWEDRLAVAGAAEEVARSLSIDFPSDEHSLARLFCVDRWQLDHRSPTVQLVYRACVEYLEKR
jgi:hypothetical protein